MKFNFHTYCSKEFFEIYNNQSNLFEDEETESLIKLRKFILTEDNKIYLEGLPYEGNPSKISEDALIRKLLDYSGVENKKPKVKFSHEDEFIQGYSLRKFVIENPLEKGFPAFLRNGFPNKWSLYFDDFTYHVIDDSIKSKPQNNKIFKGWSDLKKFSQYTNSLIISDNYFLKRFDINVRGCFENLIPSNCDVEFQITILYHKPMRDGKGELSLQVMYDEIESFITKNTNISKFNLNIVRVPKEFQHDRYIINNYFLIDCGNSFGVLKNNGKTAYQSPTKIKVQPKSAVKQGETIASSNKYILQHLKKLVMDSKEENYVGLKKNRLLGID